MSPERATSEAPSWVSALVSSCKSNDPDFLSFERQKSTVDVDGLARLLYTREDVAVQQRVLSILSKDPSFDKSGDYFDGRNERLKTSVARARRLNQLLQIHNWDENELYWALEMIGEPTAYTIHWKAFVPTLREQGTPEQQALFVSRAERGEFVGCYAQTELAHGSNVRGLETTATWNPADQTFTLHSPTLTAAKWWAGSLGVCANHAIVMAQLIIDGEGYGPHPFVCQIRDLGTHKPLEGVYVGDIGPKLGYNTVDNGFLLLNHVKVPHINMLARFSRVDPKTGTYIPAHSPAVFYSTITRLRAALVSESARNLARGLTIAVRYCAVRCQGSSPGPSNSSALPSDLQVLDHPMVQFRLIPRIAESFALVFAGQAMTRLYNELKTALVDPKNASTITARTSRLFAESHATSCGLKALATSAAVEGLEACRRACGGHGYSSFAGIGSIHVNWIPSQTYEGDNYVLMQQTANYLLKTAKSLQTGEHASIASNISSDNLETFLVRSQKKNDSATYDLTRDDDMVAAFGWRAAHLTFDILGRRDHEHQSSSALQVDYPRLSTAHSQFLVVTSMYRGLKSPETTSTIGTNNTNTLPVLWNLFRLYALTKIVEAAHEFYTSAALTVAQVVRAQRETVPRLLQDLRPHAVRLVDAWKVPDWTLDSSLGRYDGKVYEDLFYRASELNPINRLAIDPRPTSVINSMGEHASRLARL
ncbi:uncharacterized protein PV07_00394 [Cladophialophora immunda]|uniref:Acyl-coenzyme A oxidase n=1 Tax=Cladophialophora immunda TaxID=569365 RepID=A0A0D2DCY7_9EURO|nr:uncharacterized protein PV07_00394 [Cladophialophora immunda]KIW33554.1 hypothetical protein PV07_00394 [Cladophialophora immunda]OQV06753.1 hypothetical protein CLAIMM_11281 [Cladophialophora immunda]